MNMRGSGYNGLWGESCCGNWAWSLGSTLVMLEKRKKEDKECQWFHLLHYIPAQHPFLHCWNRIE